MLCGPAQHLMLEGGGRSGKTLLHVRNTVMRALLAPGSRHLIARFRFIHVRQSVALDTFPVTMRGAFPNVKYHIDKQDWYAQLPGGSEVWFAGLDDKERTEKILGMEFATIFLNECSQISWDTRELLVTRLAQRVMKQINGADAELLRTRMYYDCNPPSKAHWTYRVFHQHVNPESRLPLTNPHDFAVMRMNPEDNRENISPEYLESLRGLSFRKQKRFLYGEYGDATPNALFEESVIDKWRVMDGLAPDFVRVVVGVDPSGSGDEDNADNDAIGIVVGGLATDGCAYLLEDCTVKAGPGTWGRVATDAFERHEANTVVGEINFGGAMVEATIKAARPRTPFKKLTASRGKHVRAEPFSALYEQGKIRHLGLFPELEDEMCAMSTFGYTGTGSPNRADAWIWVLSELFPGLLSKRHERRTHGRAVYAEM